MYEKMLTIELFKIGFCFKLVAIICSIYLTRFLSFVTVKSYLDGKPMFSHTTVVNKYVSSRKVY